jgi:predicted transcriptional regulator
MYADGLIGSERPIIVLSKEVPRIEIDAQMPNWDMTLGEINHLISKWQFSNDEIGSLYENVIGLVLSEVSFSTSDGTKTVGIKDVFSLLPKLSREEIVLSTSHNLFEYFRKIRERLHVHAEPKPDFHTVKTRKEAQQIASLLKSKNALQILALANGNRTVSEIAKETNMQLSNTSQYIAKMKKNGLLAIKDKKVVRTSRGIKINFEATLSN